MHDVNAFSSCHHHQKQRHLQAQVLSSSSSYSSQRPFASSSLAILHSSNNDENNNSESNIQEVSNNDIEMTQQQSKKEHLLNTLSKVPPNQPTSKSLTDEILTSVANLELYCPTDTNSVLEELNGNWELVWTAQDKKTVSQQKVNQNDRNDRIVNRIFGNWINPLENQSYSNNPSGRSNDGVVGGRSNPILPQNIQDKLEEIGLLLSDDDDDEIDDGPAVKSIQAIDGKKKRVRNVVSVLVKSPLPIPFLTKSSKNRNTNRVRGSLTVDVSFTPNKVDARKIDVKFDGCRISVQNSPLDITIPLGPVGPTGWLRTTYIDETMRITRGHKGSVFILKRTSRKLLSKQ